MFINNSFTLLSFMSINPPNPKRMKKICSDIVLKFKKLSENATIPVRASAKAAGYDIFSAEDKVIAPRGKALIKTDLSLAIPPNHYGRIAPRSSLAWKFHIDVGAGVIDEDYRGPLGVILFNHSEDEFIGLYIIINVS